jgi:hypothetical protein
MAKRRGKKKAPKAKTKAKRQTKKTVKKPKKAAAKTARKSAKRPKKSAKPSKSPVATLRTPPSSLDMNRNATAARSGRRQLSESKRQHNKMSAVTGGDVDADMESAYFSGDGAPGGDNPTPDQNDVDDIGQAIGVKYNDNEELRGGDEVVERDRHRWENE